MYVTSKRSYISVIFSTGSDISKEQLEKWIVANGGSKVQNPTHKTNYFLALDDKNIRVSNWIQSCKSNGNPYGDKDVIHYSWLAACVQEKHLVPLHPRFMIYTSKATLELFKEKIDKYQDSFFETATIDSLKRVCDILLLLILLPVIRTSQSTTQESSHSSC